MSKLFYRTKDSPKTPGYNDFNTEIYIKGLGHIVDLQTNQVVKTFLDLNYSVILEDHPFTMISVKETFPNVENLTEIPKGSTITIIYQSEPWPG
jgi:hypothetical protein